jgi:hypothetical protein
MKKKSPWVILAFLAVMFTTKTYAQAPVYTTLTCHTNCLFGNCSITETVLAGSGRAVACGCLLGVPSCKDNADVLPDPGPTYDFSHDVTVFQANINLCIQYLNGLSNSIDFFNVIQDLYAFNGNMTAQQFDAAAATYVADAQQLSGADYQTMSNWIDQHGN